jgi:hypothetical protein
VEGAVLCRQEHQDQYRQEDNQTLEQLTYHLQREEGEEGVLIIQGELVILVAEAVEEERLLVERCRGVTVSPVVVAVEVVPTSIVPEEPAVLPYLGDLEEPVITLPVRLHRVTSPVVAAEAPRLPTPVPAATARRCSYHGRP